MNVEHIRKHLREQPFKPFRLCLSDGSSYEVRHPEFVGISQRLISVGTPSAADDIPEGMAFCDPLHITRLELITETKPRQRRNGR